MRGNIPFPDYQEENDRWQTGKRLFLASTYSLVHPSSTILESGRNRWLKIAKRTFQSGVDNEANEMKAHAELTGASANNSYLVLNTKYLLNILGSIPGTLSNVPKEQLLRWLWAKPDGIGYLNAPLDLPPPAKPGPVDRWLSFLEFLARLFPSWVDFSSPAVDWLWQQRNEPGYWDFSSRSEAISFLPLSDNWRNKKIALLIGRLEY